MRVVTIKLSGTTLEVVDTIATILRVNRSLVIRAGIAALMITLFGKATDDVLIDLETLLDRAREYRSGLSMIADSKPMVLAASRAALPKKPVIEEEDEISVKVVHIKG